MEKAFSLKSDQFNPPEWMWTQQFELQANVPLGSTKDQFLLMLQSLLRDRFQLKSHFEEKLVPGYEITFARNGPRLTKSVDEAPLSDSDSLSKAAEPPIGKDGFPNRRGITVVYGNFKLDLIRKTMADLAAVLSFQMGQSVRDATGLKGDYDIAMYWSADDRPVNASDGVTTSAGSGVKTGPTILVALQSQPGLKLIPKKVMDQVFVIDSISKTPTAN